MKWNGGDLFPAEPQTSAESGSVVHLFQFIVEIQDNVNVLMILNVSFSES